MCGMCCTGKGDDASKTLCSVLSVCSACSQLLKKIIVQIISQLQFDGGGRKEVKLPLPPPPRCSV